MTNNHDYSFFGQITGLILSSSSRSQPYLFFKCVKKKNDDTWEKLKQGEGKTVKISLEEIVMIKKVLEKRSTDWSTFHKHEGINTKISFKWSDNRVNVSIGDYFKPLTEAQTEIMKNLIDHIYYEKIEYATILSGSNYTTRKLQGVVKTNEPLNLRVEEVKVEKETRNVNINGVVNGETTKALMIHFRSGNESWIPKSTIHSKYDTSNLDEQEFLIEEWILKKNDIITI
ncbi:MAG: hypothetical protein ACFFBP_23070 [Promethearchaeota archaeon]